MYTDPLNKMLMDAWVGADSLSRRQKALVFCAPATCSPFPQGLLGAPCPLPATPTQLGSDGQHLTQKSVGPQHP